MGRRHRESVATISPGHVAAVRPTPGSAWPHSRQVCYRRHEPSRRPGHRRPATSSSRDRHQPKTRFPRLARTCRSPRHKTSWCAQRRWQSIQCAERYDVNAELSPRFFHRFFDHPWSVAYTPVDRCAGPAHFGRRVDEVPSCREKQHSETVLPTFPHAPCPTAMTTAVTATRCLAPCGPSTSDGTKHA